MVFVDKGFCEWSQYGPSDRKNVHFHGGSAAPPLGLFLLFESFAVFLVVLYHLSLEYMPTLGLASMHFPSEPFQNKALTIPLAEGPKHDNIGQNIHNQLEYLDVFGDSRTHQEPFGYDFLICNPSKIRQVVAQKLKQAPWCEDGGQLNFCERPLTTTCFPLPPPFQVSRCHRPRLRLFRPPLRRDLLATGSCHQMKKLSLMSPGYSGDSEKVKRTPYVQAVTLHLSSLYRRPFTKLIPLAPVPQEPRHHPPAALWHLLRETSDWLHW